MPDISMCTNVLCSMKETCHRYKAIPNPEGQTYSTFKEIENGEGCDHYWKQDKI